MMHNASELPEESNVLFTFICACEENGIWLPPDGEIFADRNPGDSG